MSKLFDNRYQTKDTYTENGMPTHSSSGSWVVDLFFKMGASRNTTDLALECLLEKAWEETPELAIKAVFYNRDIRGGQGERRSFRVFLKWLALNHLETLIKNIPLVPEYGRWDDLFELFGIDENLDDTIFGLVYHNLVRFPNGLLAKWMPREGKSKDALAKKFMIAYGLTPRAYRKLLSGTTTVVETAMCQKNWSEIKYAQVPSVAMNKYRKAFSKQDPERFTAWIQDVKAGKSKVNASAIFLHDIVKQVIDDPRYRIRVQAKNLSKAEIDAIQIQWDALPNYVEGNRQFIPVSDVSGSMFDEQGSVLKCLAISIYLAERNRGIFQNEIITFSSRPTFVELKGKTLVTHVNSFSGINLAESTDLEATLNLVLSRAVSANLPPEEMPETLMVLSDMQFNLGVKNPTHTALEMITSKFEAAGYKRPNIVFWNLRDSSGVPSKVDSTGIALVSGFSPSIVKQVLGDDLSPLGVLTKTLMSERYAPVTL